MPVADIKAFHRHGAKLLICHLESVKYKPDLLNTNHLSCMNLFKASCTRGNRDLSFFVPMFTVSISQSLSKQNGTVFENGRYGYV